jgi:hypothetical protein
MTNRIGNTLLNRLEGDQGKGGEIHDRAMRLIVQRAPADVGQ